MSCKSNDYDNWTLTNIMLTMARKLCDKPIVPPEKNPYKPSHERISRRVKENA